MRSEVQLLRGLIASSGQGWLQTGMCNGASAGQDGTVLVLGPGAGGRTSLAVTGISVGFCRSLGLLLQSSDNCGNNPFITQLD